MKLFSRLLVFLLFSFFVLGFKTSRASDKNLLGATTSVYLTLDGKSLSHGNPVDENGIVRQVESPRLHIIRSKSKLIKGTVLLIPGGGYEVLNLKAESENGTHFFNGNGFDVAILEYRLNRDSALEDAFKAYRLLKTTSKLTGWRGDRLDVMGLFSGGHLAARMVQRLNQDEQPVNLMLINPSFLDEKLAGTVFPDVMPPVHPRARLFEWFGDSEKESWVTSGNEYAKVWKGYDGWSQFQLCSESPAMAKKDENLFAENQPLVSYLTVFLNGKIQSEGQNVNPAAIAVPGYSPKRHAEKLALVAREKFDLIMIGNSITNNLEKPDFQLVWNQFFAPRKALNLGFSGYRTENILWNIQNGELEGQSPKVVILEIGTNNIDEKNYPTRHTAGQLAGGIEAIVRLLRQKLPETKIVVMRCFPGCYGGPNPTSHRAILERASDIVSRLADGKHVFYCDVNHVFLNMDGSINHEMMPDWLHPSPAGAKAWAQAMEPLLSELMGDKSLDTDIPANTAIVPVSKLEEDSYNWWSRHAEVLQVKDSINPEIVLIGNSITHFWGGEPRRRDNKGAYRASNGPQAWSSVFENRRVLNLGFGWDRTQNVLWRLDHGELDGLHPRTVIIHIGTNNTSQTENARMNTASEIVDGISAICLRVRSKVPGAKIILMKIFPREENPTHPRRVLINEINRQLDVFAKDEKITLLDIGPKMLTPDGRLTKEIANDYCHPTEKGYQIWADAIRPFITQP